MNGSDHQSPQLAAYSADLLGTIASNLAGLQGYDVMALELIQNADDAGATQLVLDVTDDALVVYNDASFSYCGNLSAPCSIASEVEDDACDFHRIISVASGGKARHPQNIGRFGIGFISVYQVCDHPEIRSSGIQATLLPDEQRVSFGPDATSNGTTFRLPWATDQNSVTRRKLRISHVTGADLSRMQTDVAQVLDGALLFLRHLSSIELRRNGKLLRKGRLSRDDEGLVSLILEPTGAEEMWFVLTADARPKLSSLYEEFPQLAQDKRRTHVSLALPLTQKKASDGFFYAYLPTEQSTGLPLHVNADFYPESDRKNLIFNGAKHQQHWNEGLIRVAAECVASHLHGLRGTLEPELLWDLIGKAWIMHRSAKSTWEATFWDALDEVIDASAELVWTTQRTWAQVGESVFPPKNLSAKERALLSRLGLVSANESLRSAQPILEHLGCNQLTLRRLATTLEQSALLSSIGSTKQLSSSDVSSVLEPLWDLIARLASGPDATRDVQDLFEHIPIVLGSDQRLVQLSRAHRVESHLLRDIVARYVPSIAIADGTVKGRRILWEALPKLTLQDVVRDLEANVHDAADAEALLGTDSTSLHPFYRMLADLAALDETNVAESCSTLRRIPIFLGGKGFTTAAHVCLPGGFKDPLQFAEFIPAEVTDSVIEAFFVEGLKISVLTLRSYVTDVLPRFFSGSPDQTQVNKLFRELARRGTTLDDPVTMKALAALPLIPTSDGAWHTPTETYHRTEALVETLGDIKRYWVDLSRLDSSPSVRNLAEQLGILRKPAPRHIAERILSLTRTKPTAETQNACERSFYAACEHYDTWIKQDPTAAASFVGQLSERKCLPAIDDFESWYSPTELYAPYRREAFLSQAAVLPFFSFGRLNSALLDRLGVKRDPETALVWDPLESTCRHASLSIL